MPTVYYFSSTFRVLSLILSAPCLSKLEQEPGILELRYPIKRCHCSASSPGRSRCVSWYPAAFRANDALDTFEISCICCMCLQRVQSCKKPSGHSSDRDSPFGQVRQRPGPRGTKTSSLALTAAPFEFAPYLSYHHWLEVG